MYLKQLYFQGEKNNYFPLNLPFIENMNNLSFLKPVTFITGENGSGKSTYIETIAELLKLNLEGGSKNNQFSIRQTQSDLGEYCRLIRYANYPKDSYFYRAESFYHLTSELDDIGISAKLFDKPLHSFSRGESFMSIIHQRFFGQGIYLLDEPETGLSLQSQLELLVRMNDLVNKKSQFIICTHSPILLMYPGADIIEMGEQGMIKTTAKQSKVIEQWELIFQRKDHFFEQLFDDTF